MNILLDFRTADNETLFMCVCFSVGGENDETKDFVVFFFCLFHVLNFKYVLESFSTLTFLEPKKY